MTPEDGDDDRRAEEIGAWAERIRSEDPGAPPAGGAAVPQDLKPGIRVIRGLQELLGAAAAGAAPVARGALSRLDPSMRPHGPPVLLAEPGAGPTPLLAPRPGAEGRYVIAGEIARGGMGVVLKGQDVDLGREVAIKVLREDLAGNADHVNRFVEEAQIGGQLQHPGIVPVYEIGVGEDRRPYFAMKLIKGRTLASLLLERRDTAAHRQRCLAVFEAVCQTMAYAHARGVIHRDLKPSNVMVGAFGEVLVVDWGMGKVLRRGGAEDDRRARASRLPPSTVVRTVRSLGSGTPSEVGDVMGTPTYMSPEQARGAVEDLDEQTDVFALGAILCEILTGHPPYEGRTMDVLRSAAAGGTQEARRALAACGAEPELVALANACLATEPSKRPRGAGAVASAMADYRASLERRRREAEAEVQRAEGRAAEERKGRRLTLALAAMALAILLGSGGIWRWVESDRQRRREAAAARASEAAAEAARRRTLALAAEGDASLWSEAVAAAREASAVAGAEDVGIPLREAAARTLAGVLEEAQQAAIRLRRRDEDQRLVARLEEIRQLRGDHFDLERQTREYRQAFAPYGVTAGAGGDPRALRDRLDSPALLLGASLALADWRHGERVLRRPTQGLDALLDALDPDPWRMRLRRAQALEELRELAREAGPATQPVESLVALVRSLGNAGDARGAANLARRVQEHHPGDFWANWTAGEWATRVDPPRWEEASRSYAAAVALRPEGFAARLNLGGALRARGDLDGALLQFREALRLAPELPEAHYNLALVQRAQGDATSAAASCREAIRGRSGYAGAHGELGLALLELGDLDGALAACREAARLDPSDAKLAAGVGLVLQRRGDLEGAVEALRRAVTMRADLAEIHGSLGAALLLQGRHEQAIAAFSEALRLDPASVLVRNELGRAHRGRGDLSSAATLWRQALELEPGNADALHGLGLVAAERGDFAGATEAWRKALRLAPRHPDAAANLAMAEQAAADPKVAEALLRESVSRYPGDPEIHRALGRVLRQRSDSEGAIGALREALRLATVPDPVAAGIREDLVQALREAGRLREAREAAAGR